MLTKNCHLRIVREMCDIMGTLLRKTEIIDTLCIVSIFFLLAHLFFHTFFCSEMISRTQFLFFIVRRFNSTNSIFHRPCCRGFNWAQGVSIFVECNMQSSDLSNQILVCCRLHSDGDRLLISFIRCSFILALWFLFALSCAHLEFNVASYIFCLNIIHVLYTCVLFDILIYLQIVLQLCFAKFYKLNKFNKDRQLFIRTLLKLY